MKLQCSESVIETHIRCLYRPLSFPPTLSQPFVTPKKTCIPSGGIEFITKLRLAFGKTTNQKVLVNNQEEALWGSREFRLITNKLKNQIIIMMVMMIIIVITTSNMLLPKSINIWDIRQSVPDKQNPSKVAHPGWRWRRISFLSQQSTDQIPYFSNSRCKVQETLKCNCFENIFIFFSLKMLDISIAVQRTIIWEDSNKQELYWLKDLFKTQRKNSLLSIIWKRGQHCHNCLLLLVLTFVLN